MHNVQIMMYTSFVRIKFLYVRQKQILPANISGYPKLLCVKYSTARPKLRFFFLSCGNPVLTPPCSQDLMKADHDSFEFEENLQVRL